MATAENLHDMCLDINMKKIYEGCETESKKENHYFRISFRRINNTEKY